MEQVDQRSKITNLWDSRSLKHQQRFQMLLDALLRVKTERVCRRIRTQF